jgi:hypothetical protein
VDFLEAIQQSQNRLNKLLVIVNFFDHPVVASIFIKTKVIHSIFETNAALDFNKLELFNLQFTDTFLELMLQLKKKNEQNYINVQNEIQINEGFIKKYHSEIQNNIFKNDFIKCSSDLSCFFETAYHFLAFDKNDDKTESLYLEDFCHQYVLEYYKEISEDFFSSLTNQTKNPSRVFKKYNIENKLLGKLNIHRFKVKFLCGFRYNEFYFSIFEFVHSNEHIIFNHKSFEFQLIDLKNYPSVDFSKSISNKHQTIENLAFKNKNLTKNALKNLKIIPNEIQAVISDYLEKISKIQFLEDMQNIDEQTNILRTMLNLKVS